MARFFATLLAVATAALHPALEVRLNPPANPYPELNAYLGELEEARGTREANALTSVTAAFNAALRAVKPNAQAAARALLQLPGAELRAVDVPVVRVDASDSQQVAPGVVAEVREIEQRRAAMEKSLLDEAAAALADLRALRGQGAAPALRGSFAELPEQLAVRVLPADEEYPTVGSTIDAFFDRRTKAEMATENALLDLAHRLADVVVTEREELRGQ